MIKELKRNLILTFILTLVFGLILVFQTREFLETINYVIVSVLAIIGVVQIIFYIFSKSYKEDEYYGLVMGVVCIWLALLFYMYYATIILFLPIALSLYAFIVGTITIIKFIKRKEILYIITSIISFILGILLILVPYFTIAMYTKVAGVYMIFTSIIYLLEIKKIKKK